MALWGVVFLVALSGVLASADPSLTFPETARDRSIGSRIVSGWEAVEGQIPFQLSLRMVNPVGQVNACGGSIIHADWGMTAAHCTATRVTMVIRAGAVNLTRPEFLFETTEYYNHPLYNNAQQNIVQPNDIALLRFPTTLTFSDRVQPVRMHRSGHMNRNYQGIRLVASGWGLTWTQGSSPENLNWVFLLGDSNAVCFIAFGGSNIIQDSTICASAYNVTSQSTCQGDSGGPLTVIDDDGIVSMVGVASFVSSSGCHTAFPAGFVRPGHYHDWYYNVTGINFDWEPVPETTTTTEPEPTTTSSPAWTTTNIPETDPTTTSSPAWTTTNIPDTDPTTTSSPSWTTTNIPDTDPTTTSSPSWTTTNIPDIDPTTTSSPYWTTTNIPSTDPTDWPDWTTTSSPELTTMDPDWTTGPWNPPSTINPTPTEPPGTDPEWTTGTWNPSPTVIPTGPPVTEDPDWTTGTWNPPSTINPTPTEPPGTDPEWTTGTWNPPPTVIPTGPPVTEDPDWTTGTWNPPSTINPTPTQPPGTDPEWTTGTWNPSPTVIPTGPPATDDPDWTTGTWNPPPTAMPTVGPTWSSEDGNIQEKKVKVSDEGTFSRFIHYFWTF